ncbi:unnamed protein product [Rhizoctonia solani]|uniref:BTB domain-containing protein n=1 Tax=Rhizoctonia solani TaxID=456999 RepID=A0A8H3HSZ3_9AGAM|nr:unnamed protein product [Rhizoctonia solani]
MPHSVHSDEYMLDALALTAFNDKRSPLSPDFRLIAVHVPPHNHTLPVPRFSGLIKVAHLFQPFKGSDLVLRTTKNHPHVEFYVDRETIYNHSPYLKRKISKLGPTPAGIEVVSWEEDADTLDAMLRLVYSDRSKPVVESTTQLRFLLGAARKYGIEAARRVLGTTVLFDLATREPLPAFVIACEFGLAGEATLISKETLKVDIMMEENRSQLTRMSVSSYHRLLRLHRMRAAKAIEIISLINAECPMDEFDPPYCEGCGTNATWWQVFVEFGSIELKRRPVTDTIFSAAFLAKCVRSSRGTCESCVDSYMHRFTQRLLTRLKEDIDALPAYMSSVDPPITKQVFL